ncbi:alpha/beta fold hydrolase [Nonomuraea pusilla]|uniref:alpha/beta fold hydrolase n=1 Tax=Nonomuraea pusilla TaxID=46177 RepID=UPI0015A57C62|nr:alpha/beta fold hydrolase [Nonomuraea pusilla]
MPRALDWRDCGDGLRCASLRVPVDWGRPGGAATSVDVALLPAQDPSRRLGHIVVTLGYGSTVAAVRARPDTVSELARWFDVVLAEPRGAGVRCATPQPDPARLEAAGRGGWRAFARAGAAYDRSCRRAAGAAYAGLTSWQAAHDLDALRTALGESRLTYLGDSAGAVIGQAYLELFAGRVGRMYLEGVADHTEPGLEARLLSRARAAEAMLREFRSWCAALPACPLRRRDALTAFDDLVRRAPLRAGEDRVLTAAQVASAVRNGLDQGRRTELAQAMESALHGDATALATLLPTAPAASLASAGPVPSASLASAGPVPSVEQAGLATGVAYCRDFPTGVTAYREYRQIEARLRAAAPRVGWLSGRREIARCLGIAPGPSWPPHQPQRRQEAQSPPAAARLEPLEPSAAARLGPLESSAAGRSGPLESSAAGRSAPLGSPAAGRSAPAVTGRFLAAEGGGSVARVDAVARRAGRVLVGAGRSDAVTPASGAARVAAAFPGAVLLRHGDGHGAYLEQGVRKLRASCLRSHVHDYLVNGRLPRPGTTCGGELGGVLDG